MKGNDNLFDLSITEHTDSYRFIQIHTDLYRFIQIRKRRGNSKKFTGNCQLYEKGEKERFVHNGRT